MCERVNASLSSILLIGSLLPSISPVRAPRLAVGDGEAVRDQRVEVGDDGLPAEPGDVGELTGSRRALSS